MLQGVVIGEQQTRAADSCQSQDMGIVGSYVSCRHLFGFPVDTCVVDLPSSAELDSSFQPNLKPPIFAKLPSEMTAHDQHAAPAVEPVKEKFSGRCLDFGSSKHFMPNIIVNDGAHRSQTN